MRPSSFRNWTSRYPLVAEKHTVPSIGDVLNYEVTNYGVATNPVTRYKSSRPDKHMYKIYRGPPGLTLVGGSSFCVGRA